MALKVHCANGHHTAKANVDVWRHFRGCERCGEATVVDYGTQCAHHAWRYPNPLPIDGDVCPDCRATYVEPIHGKSEAEIERLRGLAEILTVIVHEHEGLYTRREASDEIRNLCAIHGFPFPRVKR